MTAAPALVLILDDDPACGVVLAALIRDEFGAGVDAHYDDQWVEITRRIAGATPSRRTVLLFDLQMPGINGEHYCAVVKRHYPTVRAILHSGADARLVQAAGRRLGVPAVPKNADPSTLLAIVRGQILG